MSQPSLIVFDLDFTLWNCGGTWCDCLAPPFDEEPGYLADRNGRFIRFYDDVAEILDRCDAAGIPMALASRTERPPWAIELVERLGATHRFQYAEIYPSSKLRHFQALQKDSGLAFSQMLFFDDEMRNIIEVSELGVTSIHVEAGMSRSVFEEGLKRFQENNASDSR